MEKKNIDVEEAAILKGPEHFSLFGVPLSVLLHDERFLVLMQEIMRERGDEPDEWETLRRGA